MTRSDQGFVLTRIEGPVATVTLNRPERHNSLVPGFLRDLGAAITACEADPGAKVLVLRAAGRSFSTGGDLRGFSEHAQDPARYADELVGPSEVGEKRDRQRHAPVRLVRLEDS